MRGLYIHIPFCKHICNYCDFPKRIAMNSHQVEEYIKYLIEELDSFKGYYNSVKTIYIGGGTPNFLSNELLTALLEKIKSFNINYSEFTIEINPELLTLSQARLFKKYGINRVSIGAQSFIDEDLIKLNRHHKKEDILKSIKMLRDVGIDNINIDLMYAHPFDSIDHVKYNLSVLQELKVPHVSYYSMILEDKTVFSHLIEKGELNLLDNELEASMYELVISTLKEMGYHHYETSNFALKGFESAHNKLYWKGLEYVGCGAGASGYLDSLRYTNSSVLKRYYNKEKTEEEISFDEKKKEFMMLGFRLIDGVDINEYQTRFKSSIFDDFKLDDLFKRELIYLDNNMLKLTSKGIMLANEVYMEFI